MSTTAESKATFGVFGSYAVVDDDSSRSVALPSSAPIKRSRDAPSLPQQHSTRRPAPASLRLESNAVTYGIVPEGCALLPDATPPSRGSGLGKMRVLSDDILLYLIAWFDAKTLCAFSAASGAAYAFAHGGDAWRSLALTAARCDGFDIDGGAPIASTWAAARNWKSALMARAERGQLTHHVPIRVRGIYSDLLFKHIACAGTSLSSSWAAASDTLVRVANAQTMTCIEFSQQFEGLNTRPVVLEGAAPWALDAIWSENELSNAGGVSLFHCGGVRMTLKDYFAYTNKMSGKDDRPLYLFERNFVQLAPSLTNAYKTPSAIPDDLFQVLGNTEYRPDHTWLIAGPKKSGSTFHKDPNAASAWNACTRGLKAWIFYPPHTTPPGVVVGGGAGGEGSDVATPISVLEWYADHWPAHAARLKRGGVDAPVAGLQRPGDVVVVPAGWWHQVLNLQDSIAVTHNFVSPSGLSDALELVRDDPAAISGISESLQDSFYSVWHAALLAHRPQVLAAAEEEEAVRMKSASLPHHHISHSTTAAHSGGGGASVVGSKWATLIAPTSSSTFTSSSGGLSLMASWGGGVGGGGGII
jgi:hypothetical protein